MFNRVVKWSYSFGDGYSTDSKKVEENTRVVKKLPRHTFPFKSESIPFAKLLYTHEWQEVVQCVIISPSSCHLLSSSINGKSKVSSFVPPYSTPQHIPEIYFSITLTSTDSLHPTAVAPVKDATISGPLNSFQKGVLEATPVPLHFFLLTINLFLFF